jgi:hypothetical protein
MKRIALSLMVVVCVAISCKKSKNERVTVVRDCTGTYLRFNEKDYRVCNVETLVEYANGNTIKVAFSQIKVCNGPEKDAIVCMMLHPNEGWVKVQKVH